MTKSDQHISIAPTTNGRGIINNQNVFVSTNQMFVMPDQFSPGVSTHDAEDVFGRLISQAAASQNSQIRTLTVSQSDAGRVQLHVPQTHSNFILDPSSAIEAASAVISSNSQSKSNNNVFNVVSSNEISKT